MAHELGNVHRETAYQISGLRRRPGRFLYDLVLGYKNMLWGFYLGAAPFFQDDVPWSCGFFLWMMFV